MKTWRRDEVVVVTTLDTTRVPMTHHQNLACALHYNCTVPTAGTCLCCTAKNRWKWCTHPILEIPHVHIFYMVIKNVHIRQYPRQKHPKIRRTSVMIIPHLALKSSRQVVRSSSRSSSRVHTVYTVQPGIIIVVPACGIEELVLFIVVKSSRVK